MDQPHAFDRRSSAHLRFVGWRLGSPSSAIAAICSADSVLGNRRTLILVGDTSAWMAWARTSSNAGEQALKHLLTAGNGRKSTSCYYTHLADSATAVSA